MRIKLYTEDMQNYVIFYADELNKGVLKNVARQERRKKVAIPTRKSVNSGTSLSDFESDSAETLAEEYQDIVKDIESIARLHPESVLTIKAYKDKLAIGLKLSKSDVWDNVTRPTLREALQAFQKGEFD